MLAYILRRLWQMLPTMLGVVLLVFILFNWDWQLAGLLAALLGMFAGSLAPQWMKDHKGHVHHYEGTVA
eukprot:gene23666-29908_t